MLTTLFKSMVEVATLVITHIISVSLLSSEFFKNVKDVHLKPLIKIMGLDLVFKSLATCHMFLSW